MASVARPVEVRGLATGGDGPCAWPAPNRNRMCAKSESATSGPAAPDSGLGAGRGGSDEFRACPLGDGMEGGAALWRSLFVELRDQPEPRLVVVIVGGFERVTGLGRIVCGRLVCG